MKRFVTLITVLLLGSSAGAGTKEEYRAASIKGLRELTERRAKGSVRRVLDGAKDGKSPFSGAERSC
jgi:hypothetical protein